MIYNILFYASIALGLIGVVLYIVIIFMILFDRNIWK